MSSKPSSPRAFAALILAAALPEQRAQAIARCPADWREQALRHVAAEEERRAHFIKQRDRLRPAAKPAAPALGRYVAPSASRGNPQVAAQALAAARASITQRVPA